MRSKEGPRRGLSRSFGALIASLALALSGCLGGALWGGSTPPGSGFDIAGVVRSRDQGLPLAGAIVEVNNRKTTTDQDGAFSLSGVPAPTGRAYYQVVADRHASRSGSVEVRRGEPVLLEIDLFSADVMGEGTVTGRVNFALPDFPMDDSLLFCDETIPLARQVSFAPIPNDPCFSNQYYLQQIHVPAAWSVTTGSRDILVAVIDTGFHRDHPDLQDNFAFGRNFARDQEDQPVDPDALEIPDPHGTAVAGVIGATANNGVGIAGIAWDVSLMPLRVFARSGEATPKDTAEAIRFAVDQGADIINISSGAAPDIPIIHDAVRYARDNGVIVVAAAGNYGDVTPPLVPARYDEVIGVGALEATRKGLVADFSSRGPGIDVVAPGVALLTTLPPDRYVAGSGTSGSAPIVAGVIALMLANGIPAEDVKDILIRTASLIGEPDENVDDLHAYGYGMVNAYGAVTATDPMDAKVFVVNRDGRVASAVTSPDERRRFQVEQAPAGDELLLVAWIDVNHTGVLDQGDYLGVRPFSMTSGGNIDLNVNLEIFDGMETYDWLTPDLASSTN